MEPDYYIIFRFFVVVLIFFLTQYEAYIARVLTNSLIVSQ